MPVQSFAGRDVPLSVRGARLLLGLEFALLALSGIFAALIGIVLGSENSIPFAGAQVSGAGAVLLGVFYGALGLAALYISIELGRLAPWTRTAAIALQAGLIVLFLARGDFSPSTALSVALCLAVAGLLLTPTASAALTPAAGSSAAASSGAAPPSAAAPSGGIDR